MATNNHKKNIFKTWVRELYIKTCCVIGVSLLMSTGIASAQNSGSVFLLNNSQNPLKPFAVASHLESHPVFADIDGDGDLDCFSGEFNKTSKASIHFFRNEGTNSSPSFKQVSGAANPLAKVSIPGLTVPDLIDIDNDGDYDCFAGDAHSGALWFYQNVGNSTHPVFTKQSAASNPLSMVKFYASDIAEPAFADIDSDGDYDCLVTDINGEAYFYKNVGNPTHPVFKYTTASGNPFNFLEASPTNKASFYDWNHDGRIDLFIGTKYYKNTGTVTNPAFTLNTTENPRFPANSDYALRWVNLGSDVAVITGTSSGTFNFFTAKSESNIVINSSLSKAYPNPSKDEFRLSLPNKANSGTIIRITDIQGRLITTKNASGSFIQFGKELKPGVYSLQVLQDNKVVYTQKLIKG